VSHLASTSDYSPLIGTFGWHEPHHVTAVRTTTGSMRCLGYTRKGVDISSHRLCQLSRRRGSHTGGELVGEFAGRAGLVDLDQVGGDLYGIEVAVLVAARAVEGGGLVVVDGDGEGVEQADQ
jgi:hypothetical protein